MASWTAGFSGKSTGVGVRSCFLTWGKGHGSGSVWAWYIWVPVKHPSGCVRQAAVGIGLEFRGQIHAGDGVWDSSSHS